MSVVEFLGVAVSAGLVSTGVAYLLFQQFLKIQVSKVVEQHKAVLERQTERLKSELAIYTHDRTIAMTRLEAERAEAIKQLHALTFEGESVVERATRIDLTAPDEPLSTMNDFIAAVTELLEFGKRWMAEFHKRSIWFDGSSSSTLLKYPKFISDWSIEISTVFADWQKLHLESLGERQLEFLFVLRNQQQRLAEVAATDGMAVRRLLVSEFRRHLRVSLDNQG